jgi:hypothetical protein
MVFNSLRRVRELVMVWWEFETWTAEVLTVIGENYVTAY